MPIYIMLTTLTHHGRKTIKQNPERIKEVSKEGEGIGVKVLAQYAVLGSYDFVNVVEAPSNEVAARVAVVLGSRGTLQTMTMAAMTLDDFIDGIKK